MNTRRSRQRLWWLVGLAVLAVGGTGWILTAWPGSALPSAAASPGDPAPLGIVCFGHVDVEQGITALYPLVPGRVTKIEVKENETVKAGTVLLRLDDELARLRIREAEADLQAAQEQLTQALKLPEQQQIRVGEQKAAIEAMEHRLEGARAVLARKLDLARVQQLNPKEVDAAEALVRELEAGARAERGKLRELELNDPATGIKRAQADVSAKQARLEQARRGDEECLLRAPVDGTALRILTAPGDVLGAQPKQPAILFCPAGPRMIRAEVEQEFAAHVAAGQPARIQDDASTGPTWTGQVSHVSDWYTHRRSMLLEPLQFNDVRTLECLITLAPGQPPLRIGQRVRVIIGTLP